MAKGETVDKAAMPLRPLVVSERADGTMRLLSDVNNLEAAKGLGLKEMPTYVLRDLTREQEARLISKLQFLGYKDSESKDSRLFWSTS